MSNIVIRNMDMPKNCLDCPFTKEDEFKIRKYCQFTKKDIYQ